MSEESRAYPLWGALLTNMEHQVCARGRVMRRLGSRGASERCKNAHRTWCVLGRRAVLADSGRGRVKYSPGLGGREGRLFQRLLKQYGRPCTKVGGRPCVALGTPDQLCKIVSAQPKLRPARQPEHRALIGGKHICPRRLCSSRKRRVLPNNKRLVSSWSLVPLWHSQWRTG